MPVDGIPAETPPGLITQLLAGAGKGDAEARQRLVHLVHDELVRIASAHLRCERPGHSLQTSDLVNEAYLRLFHGQPVDWPARAQFFAYASSAMRHFLVSHARRRQAGKRGGDALRVSLSHLADERSAEELIALDIALDRLQAMDARKWRIVELRYFGGLAIEEICQIVALSAATVHKELRAARGWLFRAIESP